MPRKRLEPEQPSHVDNALAEKLSKELKNAGEAGQPLVYEQELRPQRLRVTVVWDEWDRLSLEERTAIILSAFELAEGAQYRQQIALASGLTVPEATAAGMLAFQVATALRKGDPVTLDQCRNAMRDEGASTLFGPDILQLRFATRQEAEACRQRLINRLPGSEDVWVISIDVAVQHFLDIDQSVSASR